MTRAWRTSLERAVKSNLGAALLIGAPAGLLPASRAARLTPTQALWTGP